MLSNEEKARYSKQTVLPEIGDQGQEKLKAARVLVIGAGGLGCPVLQYLVAAGIGTIGIADGDNVDISNLQRQVLYATADVGESKAVTAACKLGALNPHVAFNVHQLFIDNGNVIEIIRGYDIVVDGSDNFPTRYLLSDACAILAKPMVSGAIYKFEGQVSVFNYNGGPTYRCLFPEAPGIGESPNCADIGVVATLPGIIGTIQANEVIKIITGVGDVLSGKLLVIDTLTMNSHTFQFKLNEANRNITELRPAVESLCDMPAKQLAYDTLVKMQQNEMDVQLVDVREANEHMLVNIGGINLPFSQFATAHTFLDPQRTTVVYCASGMRGSRAAAMLIEKGFRDVFNLENGINPLNL